MTNYEKYRALRAAVERVLHYLASPVHILGISPNDQRVEAIRMLNAAFAATPAEPESPAPDADTFDAFDKPLHPERYEDTPPAPAPVTPDVAKILEVRCDDDLPDDVIELHYGPHTVARITLRPEPTTVEPTPADPPPPLTDEDAKRCAAIHTDEGDIYLIPDDILQKLRVLAYNEATTKAADPPPLTTETKLRKSQCSAFQIVDWFFDCNKMKSNLAEAIVGMHDEEIRAWAQEKEAHDVK